jgi:hypothetical protein
MKKIWRKPELCVQDVAMEVTGYQGAEVDVEILI